MRSPIDPESGYVITNEDFDPHKRNQKLKQLTTSFPSPTSNIEEMLWLSCGWDDAEALEPYRSELEKAEELDRLALIITVNGQSYISEPLFMDMNAIGTEDNFLMFSTFKPIDFKEDFRQPREILGIWEERQGSGWHEGIFEENFKLGFPVDEEALKKIKAKFVLLPPEPVSEEL